jgi:hypothetical protein
VEIAPGSVVDRVMTFDEYSESTQAEKIREAMILKAA